MLFCHMHQKTWKKSTNGSYIDLILSNKGYSLYNPGTI